MAVKPIPDGYHTVTPYLVVEGASDLLAFMKEAFGATERMRMDGPGGAIMHSEVQIGDSVVMCGDAQEPSMAKAAMLHIFVEDVDAMYKRAVAAGGASLREPTDQFYGDRSGGVKDRWGNEWWIATHIEDVSPEEIMKRAEAAAG